MLNIFDVAAHL